MKTYIIILLTFVHCSLLAQSFTFSPSIWVESRSYAPVVGTTLSEHPVIDLVAVAKWKGFQGVYFKSIDPFAKSGGDYDMFVIVRPVEVGSLTVTPQFLHFADWRFDRQGLSVLRADLSGCESWNWAVRPSVILFHTSSPMWLVWSSLTRGQVSVHSWLFHESVGTSTSLGVEWKSKPFAVSDKLEARLGVNYNESLTKLLQPEASGFGQQHTFTMKVTLQPKG